MTRILGLDVGSKTIGIAITDESGRIAFPGTTLVRQEGWKRDMATLRALVHERRISLIVVGMPVMMNGAHGVQADKVTAFVERLRRNVRIPIVLQDERLSTREAERLLAEADHTPSDRKRVVDSVAASIILQAYIDHNEATEIEFDKE